MKWKLLLCGSALLAAGCTLSPNGYSSHPDRGYAFDRVPSPVPDLTTADATELYGSSAAPFTSEAGGSSGPSPLYASAPSN